jgi:hypothetical protein
MKLLEHIPYFYIIQHIPSGKYYAGAKWADGCHPDNFMVEGGYTTSSNKVNDLIKETGLQSFKIELIITDFGSGMSAYEYETVFLQHWDIANNDDYLNKHNNDLAFDPSKPKTPEHQAKINLALKGLLRSQETKDKIRIANLGKKHSQETKNKVSIAGKGRIVTQETRDKISSGNMGKKRSEEQKQKLRKPKSEEQKQKLSDANLGKTHSLETKKKMSDSKSGVNNVMFGKTHSTETKKKLSESNKGKLWYNDGINNYVLNPGELPDISWKKGTIPRKKCITEEQKLARSLYRQGYKWYTDGVRNYQVFLNQTPNPDWVRGRVKIN